MGRKLGSKNKSKQLEVKPEPVVVKIPDPYHDSEVLKAIHTNTVEELKALGEEYGATEVPQRLLDRANSILRVPTLEAANTLNKGLWQSMLTHVLAQWAAGKIPGKMSELSVRTKVKKALALADFLDSKNLPDQADSQRQRAQEIQDEWDSYKKNQALEAQNG